MLELDFQFSRDSLQERGAAIAAHGICASRQTVGMRLFGVRLTIKTVFDSFGQRGNKHKLVKG